jgi:penicillin-binding protein 1A
MLLGADAPRGSENGSSGPAQRRHAPERRAEAGEDRQQRQHGHERLPDRLGISHVRDIRSRLRNPCPPQNLDREERAQAARRSRKPGARLANSVALEMERVQRMGTRGVSDTPAPTLARDARSETDGARIAWWQRGRRYLVRAAVVLAVLLALLVAAAAIYMATLPSVGDAGTRVQRILTLHHGTYARSPAPSKLSDAVVAVEDEHFYSNFVVNVLDGAGRAALATLQASSDPGGSTIPQQLAKQLYGDGSSLGATLREIGLGVKLSLHFSKAEVLNMYLNAVYYGHGYWGYVAAARGYFDTAPDRLDWAEASMLAGLPQAPSAYDPTRHFSLARERQRHVLDQLVANHYLTAAQADTAFRVRLPLK